MLDLRLRIALSIIISTLVGVLVFYGYNYELKYIVAAFIFFAFIFTISINLKTGVVFYLVIRSSMDLLEKINIIFGLNLASLITIILVYCISIELFKKQIKIKPFKHSKPIILFLIALIPSAILSNNFTCSIVDYSRLLTLYFAYCAIYYLFEYSEIKIILVAILCSLIIPSICGISEIIRSNLSGDIFNRVSSTFVHPNMFAFYLLTIIMLLIIDNYESKVILNKRYSTALTFILLVFLLLTYTRAAWISLIIGIVILCVFLKKKAIPLVLMVVIALVVLYPIFAHRFSDLASDKPDLNYRINSWAWRLMVWKNSLTEIQGRWLVGRGLGVYSLEQGFYAHNDYLRFLYEAGILGAMFYVLFLFSNARNALRGLRTRLDNLFYKEMSLYIFVITIMYAAISISDNLSRSLSILTYYIVLLAIWKKADDIRVRNESKHNTIKLE